MLNCPKVNYKLNYRPGLLICPRTHEMIKFEDVKDQVVKYSKMPIKFKQDKLEHCQLSKNVYGFTDREQIAMALEPDIV